MSDPRRRIVRTFAGFAALGISVAGLLSVLGMPGRAVGARLDPTACAPPQLGPGTGEGLNSEWLPRTVGDLRVGVLFVDFADVRGTADPKTFYDGFMPRVVEWYEGVSYGRLRLRVTVLPRRFMLPGIAGDYTGRDGRKLADDTVAAADADVDFSEFDALHIVIPSRARQVPAGWVNIADPPARADGAEHRVRFFLYDEVAEGYDQADFVKHETGHMLGLPDLYVVGNNDSYHSWDIMASGALPQGVAFPGGMFAWHRWKLAWLDPDQIVCLNGRKRVEAVVTPLERRGASRRSSSAGGTSPTSRRSASGSPRTPESAAEVCSFTRSTSEHHPEQLISG